MFNNIGGKLKGLAAFLCWGGIIASVIGGASYWVFLANSYRGDIEGFLYFLLIAGLGSLFSWIGSLTTYAIGEIAENSATALEEQKEIRKRLESLFQKEESTEAVDAIKQIKSIGKEFVSGKCDLCGKANIPVNICPSIDQNDCMKHILICKDCQKKYSTPSDQ